MLEVGFGQTEDCRRFARLHAGGAVDGAFRFANKYCYLTALNKSAIDKTKLLDPATVLPENLTAALSLTARFDRIPDSIKQLALSQLELKVADETKLLEGLANTWGKTWHIWPDPKTALPTGEPLLMWSATKDGQVSAETLAERDKQFKVSTVNVRKRRAHIGPVPQLDFPKSLDDIGRQWTNDGPDVPKRK